MTTPGAALLKLLETRPKVPAPKGAPAPTPGVPGLNQTAPAAAPAAAAPPPPGAAPTVSQTSEAAIASQWAKPAETVEPDVAPAAGPITPATTGEAAPAPLTPEAAGAVKPPTQTAPPAGTTPKGDIVAGAMKSGEIAKRAAPTMPRNFIRNYNFDQMDSPEGVLKLIDQVAAVNRPAGRKVQGWEATKTLAQDITFDDLAGRTPSGARSAEETQAAGDIMLELADRMTKLGTWMAENSGQVAPDHEFAMRQYAAQMTAVEQVFSEAANEAGRTLNILRSVKQARGLANQAQAIQTVMAEWGPEGGQKLATIIQAASAPPAPGVSPQAAQKAKLIAVAKAARMASLPTFRDMWTAAYRNSLYTFKSIIRNIDSALAMSLLLEPLEKVATAGVGVTRRAFGSTAPRAYASEALARYASLVGQSMSFVRSMRIAAAQGRAWDNFTGLVSKRRGLGQQLKGEIYATPVSASNVRALANPNRSDVGRVGKAVGRIAGKLPTGWLDGIGAVIHLNDNILSSTDDMLIASNYEAESFALAIRQTLDEGVQGAVPRLTRMAEILENLTDPQMAKAMDNAQEIQFTNQQQHDIIGNMVKAARVFRVDYPVIGNLLLPFVNTPGNLMRWTLTHSLVSPLLRSSQARMALGGIEQDRVIAQMALGTGYMGAAAYLWYDGKMTGSSNTTPEAAELARAANVPKTSFIVGDIAVSFKNAIDPLGMLLNLTGNYFETMWAAPTAESYAEKAMSFGLAAGATLVDQSMMMGMARIVDSLSMGNEVDLINQMTRFGVDYVIYPLTGSFGGFIRQITRDTSGKPIVSQQTWDAMSPEDQQKHAPAEFAGGATVPITNIAVTRDLDMVRQSIVEVKNTWPFWNDDIAYKVDRWGNPVKNWMNAFETYVSPVNVEDYVELPPRDALLVRLGIDLQAPPTKWDEKFETEDGAYIEATINLAHFDYEGHDALTEPGWAGVRFQERMGKGRREVVDKFVAKQLNPDMLGVDSVTAAAVMKGIMDSDTAVMAAFLAQEQIKKQMPINGDLVIDIARGEKKAVIHPAAKMPPQVEFGP